MRTPVIHFQWKKELQGGFETPWLGVCCLLLSPLPSRQGVWGGGIPIAPAQASHGWEAEVPTLRGRGDGCFFQPSQGSGLQQARGASQGPGYAATPWRGFDVSRSSPVPTSDWASSDGHTRPSWCLVRGQEGEGLRSFGGLVGGGTRLDPTPALPGRPARPTRCPLADPVAWRRARTSSAGPLKLLPSQRKRPFFKQSAGSVRGAGGEQGESGRGARGEHSPLTGPQGPPASSYTPPERGVCFQRMNCSPCTCGDRLQ